MNTFLDPDSNYNRRLRRRRRCRLLAALCIGLLLAFVGFCVGATIAQFTMVPLHSLIVTLPLVFTCVLVLPLLIYLFKK